MTTEITLKKVQVLKFFFFTFNFKFFRYFFFFCLHLVYYTVLLPVLCPCHFDVAAALMPEDSCVITRGNPHLDPPFSVYYADAVHDKFSGKNKNGQLLLLCSRYTDRATFFFCC